MKPTNAMIERAQALVTRATRNASATQAQLRDLFEAFLFRQLEKAEAVN